jgi:hypothetical protein
MEGGRAGKYFAPFHGYFLQPYSLSQVTTPRTCITEPTVYARISFFALYSKDTEIRNGKESSSPHKVF